MLVLDNIGEFCKFPKLVKILKSLYMASVIRKHFIKKRSQFLNPLV